MYHTLIGGLKMATVDTHNISLIHLDGATDYKSMNDTTYHDLGLDELAKRVTEEPKEQQMIQRTLSQMTSSPEVAALRQDIFYDLLTLPDIRKKLLDLMNRIEYLRDYGSWRKSSDEKADIWDLLHRLDEINSYIIAVEELRECLSDPRIKSEGLLNLKRYVDELYTDSCFEELKKDTAMLKTDTASIQSVTVGINVNSRFEAESLGLVSVNAKQFKKSGIVGNFADAISAKDRIKEDTEWDGDMHYIQADQSSIDGFINRMDQNVTALNTMRNPLLMSKATLSQIPSGDGSVNSTLIMANAASKICGHIVKKLRSVLEKYTDVSIATISRLIPELIYYIRFAEFIEKETSRGMHFCKPSVISGKDDSGMNAEGLYNIKLLTAVGKEDEIVYNDLVFDKDHVIYLLTGANRGGKTTLTQAVGQLFALAQGGIFVPAFSFSYTPVDMIYTHFPADEDKTFDLGRLGEECVRFRKIFDDATSLSLILLNETFSTTSFEEGYYIATDAVRALISKNVRTIFNTHMHKLAQDTKGLGTGTASIVMQSIDGQRSFKVTEMPPEGMSYAHDIASKYGVTYEMLTGE